MGENVELYNFSMSYLASFPTITVLTPSWMSAYILHARTHAHLHAQLHTCADPSINKKNSESSDTLLIGYRLKSVFVAMLLLVTLTDASHQHSCSAKLGEV